MRYGGDTKDVLQRARAAGVSRMTVIGTRAADSEAAVQLSEHEEGVFCAVGIHPNDVDDVDLGFLLPILIADLEKRENALQNLRDQADGIVGQRGSAADKTAELVREAMSAVDGHLDMLRQQEKRLKNNVATTAP